MRVSEIMDDYRRIQGHMAAIRANPSAEEYQEEGYAVLRRCEREARAVLNQPFHLTNDPNRDEEETKTQLRRCD